MKANQNTALLYDPFLKTNLTAMLKGRPICLLQVGDKPLIAHWCEYCVQHGITQMVIYAHKHVQAVRDFVGVGRRWGNINILVIHCEKPMTEQQAITASKYYCKNVVLAKTNCLPAKTNKKSPILIDDLKALWLANMAWLQQAHVSGTGVPACADISTSGNSYIGRHCKLLPQTRLDSVVIEHECFIHEHCNISNSLITHGSIVGDGVKLNSAIVDGKLLYRADLDLVTWINDPRILASNRQGLDKTDSINLIAQSLTRLTDLIRSKFSHTPLKINKVTSC